MRPPAGDGDVALGIECALPAAYPLGQPRSQRFRPVTWLLELAHRIRSIGTGQSTTRGPRH